MALTTEQINQLRTHPESASPSLIRNAQAAFNLDRNMDLGKALQDPNNSLIKQAFLNCLEAYQIKAMIIQRNFQSLFRTIRQIGNTIVRKIENSLHPTNSITYQQQQKLFGDKKSVQGLLDQMAKIQNEYEALKSRYQVALTTSVELLQKSVALKNARIAALKEKNPDLTDEHIQDKLHKLEKEDKEYNKVITFQDILNRAREFELNPNKATETIDENFNISPSQMKASEQQRRLNENLEKVNQELGDLNNGIIDCKSKLDSLKSQYSNQNPNLSLPAWITTSPAMANSKKEERDDDKAAAHSFSMAKK